MSTTRLEGPSFTWWTPENRLKITSKTWQVNAGWVIAANIAADLTAWTRLLGFRDDADLHEADPDTLRPVNRTMRYYHSSED